MNQILTDQNYLEKILSEIREIDSNNISNITQQDTNVDVKVIEEQKVYSWIRVYLRDENPNIEIGDDIRITYKPSGEYLDAKFICYNKKGMDKDVANQIANYNPEDDKKAICLMVDEAIINKSETIPFLRTLFSCSRYYDEVVYRITDVELSVESKSVVLDYYTISF
jgi:hypothetical protein